MLSDSEIVNTLNVPYDIQLLISAFAVICNTSDFGAEVIRHYFDLSLSNSTIQQCPFLEMGYNKIIRHPVYSKSYRQLNQYYGAALMRVYVYVPRMRRLFKVIFGCPHEFEDANRRRLERLGTIESDYRRRQIQLWGSVPPKYHEKIQWIDLSNVKHSYDLCAETVKQEIDSVTLMQSITWDELMEQLIHEIESTDMVAAVPNRPENIHL